MNSETPPQNLERLLERLEQAGEPGEPVSIECMLQATDERSFGALLLVPGLLVFSPLSGIPGLPSVFAVMVSLIAVQLLIGRKHFWLPKWLLKRSASRSKYDKAIAVYEDALQRYPDDPEIMRNLGAAYMAAKNYKKAIPILERAAAAAPGPRNTICPTSILTTGLPGSKPRTLAALARVSPSHRRGIMGPSIQARSRPHSQSAPTTRRMWSRDFSERVSPARTGPDRRPRP